MILNNYKTIQTISSDYKNKKLTRNLLLELHKMLTDETDISKDEIGRFRTDDDEVVVGGENINKIGHMPPKEVFLQKEIDRLIELANDEDPDDDFIHPIIKAIFIHFWIGYLHPFTDGNSRLARSLFYWYLLRKGYWAISYLPVSVMIKRSPIQYRDAYIFTEQDGLDLTYFIDYNIKKISLAIKDFRIYTQEKTTENKKN